MFAFDQRLPGGVLLSASWISNIARRQIFITDENLKADTAAGGLAGGFTPGFGFGRRHVWGEQALGSGNRLWTGGRISDRFGAVLRVGNRRGNYSYAATILARNTCERRRRTGSTCASRRA